MVHGAAKPGEFTLRASLNGGIDLSQAEAVADLIASNSKAFAPGSFTANALVVSQTNLKYFVSN